MVPSADGARRVVRVTPAMIPKCLVVPSEDLSYLPRSSVAEEARWIACLAVDGEACH